MSFQWSEVFPFNLTVADLTVIVLLTLVYATIIHKMFKGREDDQRKR